MECYNLSVEKKDIKIVSKKGGQFQTELTIASKKYLITTEDERPKVVTRAYFGGQIVLSRKSDYSEMLKSPDFERRLYELMEFQHRNVLEVLRTQKLKEAKGPSDYLSEVRAIIRKKKEKEALELLKEGLGAHPGDPFLMSYYGCLDAVVNRNYSSGINDCREALKALRHRVPFGAEFFYPVLYLNLGRAYLAAGRKKEAVDAFRQGLLVDKENADLLWEMQRLGLRKKPPLPFLKRSNPLNKYIGLLLHKLR